MVIFMHLQECYHEDIMRILCNTVYDTKKITTTFINMMKINYNTPTRQNNLDIHGMELSEKIKLQNECCGPIFRNRKPIKQNPQAGTRPAGVGPAVGGAELQQGRRGRFLFTSSALIAWIPPSRCSFTLFLTREMQHLLARNKT